MHTQSIAYYNSSNDICWTGVRTFALPQYTKNYKNIWKSYKKKKQQPPTPRLDSFFPTTSRRKRRKSFASNIFPDNLTFVTASILESKSGSTIIQCIFLTITHRHIVGGATPSAPTINPPFSSVARRKKRKFRLHSQWIPAIDGCPFVRCSQ